VAGPPAAVAPFHLIGLGDQVCCTLKVFDRHYNCLDARLCQMGLAGRKEKQRIGRDPRNLTWAQGRSYFFSRNTMHSHVLPVLMRFLLLSAPSVSGYTPQTIHDSDTNTWPNLDGPQTLVQASVQIWMDASRTSQWLKNLIFLV
jgi:hypothetical protein